MNVAIQMSEAEEAKALPILLRHFAGTIHSQRTYVVNEMAAEMLRDAGILFSELGVVDSQLGVSDLAGRYRDDPTLREICDEIYRERDADPNRDRTRE